MARFSVISPRSSSTSPWVKEGESVPIIVHRAGDPEGKTETLNITADRGDMDTTGFLQLGITPSEQLEGPAARRGVMQEIQDDKGLVPNKYTYAVMPGEKVTAINGQPINPNDPNDLHSFWKLDQAVQSSNGKPVNLTVSDGKTTPQVQITPRFAYPFSGTTNFLGLVPRTSVLRIIKTSDATESFSPAMRWNPSPSIPTPSVIPLAKACTRPSECW